MALTLRTDDEMERALTALAEAEGASRQEVIRRAVLERYERSGHMARVQESVTRMTDRWGDVLERLGKGVSGVEYLDIEDALRMVRSLGVGPVRDLGLLDSALARPRSTAFGQDAYPTLALKAAALLHSLVGNHALIDGNKRLGLLAMAVFLDLNGYSLDLSDDAAFELVIGVATGAADVHDIAGRLPTVAR